MQLRALHRLTAFDVPQKRLEAEHEDRARHGSSPQKDSAEAGKRRMQLLDFVIDRQLRPTADKPRQQAPRNGLEKHAQRHAPGNTNQQSLRPEVKARADRGLKRSTRARFDAMAVVSGFTVPNGAQRTDPPERGESRHNGGKVAAKGRPAPEPRAPSFPSAQARSAKRMDPQRTYTVTSPEMAKAKRQSIPRMTQRRERDGRSGK
jgi:hypothetical protein